MSKFRRIAEPPTLWQDWGQEQEERKVTWTELFYDLLYVVASMNLSHQVVLSPTAQGVGHFLLYYTLFWFNWCSMTLHSTRVRTEGLVWDLGYFTQMLGVLGMVLHSTDVSLHQRFAGSLAVTKATMIAAYASTAVFIPRARASSVFLALLSTLTCALSLAAALAPGDSSQTWHVFIGLMVAEICIEGIMGPMLPLLLFPRALLPVHVEHMAERYGLIMMIFLGESIVNLGLATLTFSANQYGAITLGCFVVWSLHLFYFHINPSQHQHAMRLHRIRGFAWNYAHWVLGAMFLLFGAGLSLFISSYLGGAESAPHRLLLQSAQTDQHQPFLPTVVTPATGYHHLPRLHTEGTQDWLRSVLQRGTGSAVDNDGGHLRMLQSLTAAAPSWAAVTSADKSVFDALPPQLAERLLQFELELQQWQLQATADASAPVPSSAAAAASATEATASATEATSSTSGASAAASMLWTPVRRLLSSGESASGGSSSSSSSDDGSKVPVMLQNAAWILCFAYSFSLHTLGVIRATHFMELKFLTARLQPSELINVFKDLQLMQLQRLWWTLIFLWPFATYFIPFRFSNLGVTGTLGFLAAHALVLNVGETVISHMVARHPEVREVLARRSSNHSHTPAVHSAADGNNGGRALHHAATMPDPAEYHHHHHHGGHNEQGGRAATQFVKVMSLRSHSKVAPAPDMATPPAAVTVGAVEAAAAVTAFKTDGAGIDGSNSDQQRTDLATMMNSSPGSKGGAA